MIHRPALAAFHRSLSDPRVSDGLLFCRATLAHLEAERYADRRTQLAIVQIIDDLDLVPDADDDRPQSST